MSHPDVDINHQEVAAHSRAVNDTAGMLFDALAGAQYVNMHDEVYGILCSPFVLPDLNPVQNQAVDEIGKMAKATQHIADLLKTMADNLQMTDDAAAQRLQTEGGN
jgi:Excreted virulence factor EspC, type VII ESX diderm